MSTFAELIEALSRQPALPCQDFLTAGAEVVRRSAADVLESAHQRGKQLLRLGLQPGDRVGLMIAQAVDFLPLIHGCLLYGLVAVPLYPPPVFGDAQRHGRHTGSILTTARAAALVVDERTSARLPELPIRVVGLAELDAAAGAESGFGARPKPADLALLQFTSGSTSEPKGVRVTHAALMANARAIMCGGLAAGPGDRGVSWLPLYHDMGLIGFGLAPLLTRTPVTFIPTARFIRSPSIWLSTISQEGATITFAPNFAYALCARRVDPTGLNLRTVRMWGCGAEPVSEAALSSFEARFAPCGVRPRQIAPCYGLAEATLAVTFTPPSSCREGEDIDAELWEEQGVARPTTQGRTLHFVSCGRALPDHGVRIVGPDGAVLPERQAGEIVVDGPSVADGYEGAPESSERAFCGGGCYTGDQGYLAGGKLFVTGRLKDVVIVNGRNYAPQLIEELANDVDGVRASVAVNRAGARGDELWLLVERQKGDDDDTITEGVRARVAAGLGVAVEGVVCLAPGGLPKTTSGKVRRRAARLLLPQP